MAYGEFMRCSWDPGYIVPLPPRHSFPMEKFGALRDLVVREGIVREDEIVGMEECPWETLGLVHTDRYLSALREGKLSEREERVMGLPWSEALVRRSRLAVQGTINAVGFACEDGLAANLAGGTHHAHPDFGQGFCVLNDVAVAIREHRRRETVDTVLVVDLDVHQGNGTASIFEYDRSVYTFSVHGAKNFPLRKARSTRDVPVPDRMNESDYLATAERHLICAFNEAELMKRRDGTSGLDLTIYVQGVDVCEDDKFGRLGISRAALAARDRRVLEEIDRRGVPGVLLLGGGYAQPPLPEGVEVRRSADHTLTSPELTAHLHATMHREASQLGLIDRARARRSAGVGAVSA